MKSSKAQVQSRVHKIPEVRYEGEELTSFSGAVLLQALFANLDLRKKLRRCFASNDRGKTFGLAAVFLQLVVHVLLGFRRISDRDYYANDPLICRVLGLCQLAHKSTISRTLCNATLCCAERARALLRELVLDRLRKLLLPRVTLDFDGSVVTTKAHAEGSAMGYSPKKYGRRSYYPLFCTVSQTGQFLDMLHRSGNVHDSNGSVEFITDCVTEVHDVLPRAQLESRLDSAFFSEKTADTLESASVEYTISVPFERLVALKKKVEQRCRWRRLDSTWSYFELDYKPDKWSSKPRFVAIRKKQPKRRKGPLQLDLFEPRDHEYQYKVIMTNKVGTAKAVLLFHNGRGSQEGLIGEGKHWAQLDYVPCRRWVANQLWACACLFAHNLVRELQMLVADRRSNLSSPTRPAQWEFMSLGTFCRRFIQRAGRLNRPQGLLTLTVSATGKTRGEFQHHLDALLAA